MDNINIPIQWKDSYTKYPHGYTIFEAITAWATQVNLMIDHLNLTDIQIAKLFTDTLPENVENVLNQWYIEGKITELVQLDLDNLRSDLNEIVVVKPNGVNDTTNIQNAVNSFGVLGGKVELKKGKQGSQFKINATIAIPNNVILDCNNMEIMLLTDVDYVITALTENIQVKNLKISKALKDFTAKAFKISGINHTFDNIRSSDQVWGKFFHCVNMKESKFEHIRVDNDVTNKTGDIFIFDHCVNNTFDSSMIGFCDRAIYCSTVADPLNLNMSEGLLFDKFIIVYADKGITGDSITHLTLTNSILDFIGSHGVYVTNGQSLIVDSNWISVNQKDNSIGIGVHGNFNGAAITNNHIIGNLAYTNSQAISCNADDSIIKDNRMENIKGGISTKPTTICDHNTVKNGAAFVYDDTLNKIRSGSNPNGHWIRYEDGTQECYISVLEVPLVAGVQTVGTWTFPSEFIDTDVSMQLTIGAIGTTFTFNVNQAVSWVGALTSANYALKVDVTQTYNISLRAIGRYKA